MKRYFQNNKVELLILFLILCLAVFLRFYKINELHFFTYDQARDALYIKRMVVDHKWRLLGTQTSYPGVYCPPFYYYSSMLFLWLFKLNPVGLDVYTAFFGVLTVFLIWFVADKFFGKPAGILIAPVYATMPLIVELSRRAWNLNTLPFFVLVTIYFLWQLWQSWKFRDLVIVSAAFGYTISLHMGAPAILPILAISWITYLFKTKKLGHLIAAFLVFFFFLAPVVVFDFRHNHLLFNDFRTYFLNGQRIGFSKESFLGPVMTSFFTVFTVLLSGNFTKVVGGPLDFSGKISQFLFKPTPVSVVAHKPFQFEYQWWGIVLTGLVIGVSVYHFLKNRKKEIAVKATKSKIALGLIWGWIFVGIVVSRLYVGKFYFFYYTFLFPLPFLILGFGLKSFWQKRRWVKIGLVLLVLYITVFNLSRAKTFDKPDRTISDLMAVAQLIAQDNPPPLAFNLATNQASPDRWDHNAVDYRYFVEAFFRKKPLDWLPEDYQKAEILYVIDEDSLVNPLISPIMEIMEFKPKKILKTWRLNNGYTIYKLGRIK